MPDKPAREPDCPHCGRMGMRDVPHLNCPPAPQPSPQELLRAVAQAVVLFHGARVWDDAASERWHRLTRLPSTTKGLCDFARAALAAPPDDPHNNLLRLTTANTELGAALVDARELLADARVVLDEIHGLLGGEGDPEGEQVARSAGALRDRIDAALKPKGAT